MNLNVSSYIQRSSCLPIQNLQVSVSGVVYNTAFVYYL